MCEKLNARGYNTVQQRIKGTRRLDNVHSFFMGDDGLFLILLFLPYIDRIKAFYVG